MDKYSRLAMTPEKLQNMNAVTLAPIGQFIPRDTGIISSSPLSKNSTKTINQKQNKLNRSCRVECKFCSATCSLSLRYCLRRQQQCAIAEKVWGNVDCLTVIFSFLSFNDLLRASRVCTAWRIVLEQSSLWKTIKIRRLAIIDWKYFSKLLDKYRTTFLDLRGLHHGEDEHTMWQKFTNILPSLKWLEHLAFSQVPPYVLLAVSKSLPRLLSLTTECIAYLSPSSLVWGKYCRIDIGQMSRLRDLQVLKLRGPQLILPAIAFSGGLPALAQLTSLTCLSLFDFRGVNSEEFVFLGSLTLLEILEIGDCYKWDAEVFKAVSTLHKLKRLQLVNGGSLPDPGLTDALMKLNKLQELELIHYKIPLELKYALQNFECLDSFTISPYPGNEVLFNSNTLYVLSGANNIKKIRWEIGCNTITNVRVFANDTMELYLSTPLPQNKQKFKVSFYNSVFQFNDVDRPPWSQDENAIDTSAHYCSIRYMNISSFAEHLHFMLPTSDIKVYFSDFPFTADTI